MSRVADVQKMAAGPHVNDHKPSRHNATRTPYPARYVIPRCADALSKGIGSGFGDSLVLFAAAAADADGAYYLAVPL